MNGQAKKNRVRACCHSELKIDRDAVGLLVIDHDDTIIAHSGEFHSGAYAAACIAPFAGRIEGATLWNFLASPDTRYLYLLILNKVRIWRTTFHVSFRHDAPDQRRAMLLEFAPLGNGCVRLQVFLRNARPQNRLPHLEPAAQRDLPRRELCGFCQKVHLPAEGWLPPEDYAARAKAGELAPHPRLVDRICPDCLEFVNLTLELNASLGSM
jgi:hypothetical protein